MTESQEVSKLKECMNRKGMFVQVEGEEGCFFEGFYSLRANFKFPFKVSKVRCVTALARANQTTRIE